MNGFMMADPRRIAPTSGFDPAPAVRAAGLWARRLTGGRPHLLIAGATLPLCSGAWYLAYLLRFEFSIPDPHDECVLWAMPLVVLAQILAFRVNGVFRILWPYAGVRDAFLIFRGVAVAAAALYALNALLLPPGAVPRSVVLLDAILASGAVGGLFVLLRGLRESLHRGDPDAARSTPVLIVGAGDAGDALLREIERGHPAGYRAVGFLDDDPDKHGGLLRGVPVLGPVSDVRRLARERGVRRAIVATPRADGATLRAIVGPLLKAGLSVKLLPPFGQLSRSAPLVPQLKDVAIEDLLRREPVRLDEGRIASVLRGRSVLVTGAAGSIGSELCRQILRFRPARLVALDWAETPLHDLMLELRKGEGGPPVHPVLGDVTDGYRIRSVFDEHAPDVIFHAAALKHVPVCEDHPREAIRVNVGGTRTVAEQASVSGAELFVLISTDKAVNPSSVMGSTKRAAELVLQGFHDEAGPSRFTAVRFGNVLGSNGSVLNIFRGQLERGEPLTVTHPEMRRYFMTIPEAVQLVLQAAVEGRGADVFELDMGEPVRIVDLAEDFIRLAGLRPGGDVKIRFTGMRPGEKLFEELYLNSEMVVPTSHPKVFRLKAGDGGGVDPAVLLCLDRMGPLEPLKDPELGRLQEVFEEMAKSAQGTSAR